MLILMFTVPRQASPGQLAYILFTNVLLTAIFYTAVAVPYGSLITVRTESQAKHANMGTWRAAGYISGMIIAITIIPVTNILGETQSAWIKFGTVFGFLSILCFIICWKVSKEKPATLENTTEDLDQEEPTPFKEAIVKLFHNKYWVMLLVMNFIVNILYSLGTAGGSYYAKWIYGDDNLMGIMGGIGLLPTLVGFATVGPMTKKWGITKTLKISFIIGFAANVIRIINPYNFFYNMLLGCFSTWANIPMMCLMGVLVAMSIDFNEFTFGKRMVGTSNAASSFGCKIGSGIGGSVIGWCLAAAGYVSTQTVASMATKQAIFTYSIYMPAAFILIILISKFDLEKRIPEFRSEINKRNEAKV